MALEELTDEEIAQLEEELIGHVPADGSAVGNVTLIAQLNWSDSVYWAVRNRLINNGVLEKGRGRGGSVRRTETEAPGPALDGAVAQDGSNCPETLPSRLAESELYDPMKKVIVERWAIDAGFDEHIAEITAMQGRRDTGGKWSRPDILLAAVTTYPYVPGKYLDVITFEVKPSDCIDIAAVYEAVAHYRAAHRSYVLFHVPDSMGSSMENHLAEICEEAMRQGIGVIVAADPEDGSTWENRVEAIRHEPDPKRLNDFLVKQAGSYIKDKINRWFR